MVSPSFASASVWRSEPGPLSAVVVTMRVAALPRKYLGTGQGGGAKQSEEQQTSYRGKAMEEQAHGRQSSTANER